jgi:hypothetical protein
MTLEDLFARRAYDCRLTPDRALESVDDAAAFLRGRGMLTRTADSALPSLFAACHEEPYAQGSRGFGSWPRTKYPWFWELAEREDVYELAIHRGRSILLTAETAALADPLCRGELTRREAGDDDGARLLRHLAETGASELDDLKVELGWGSAHLRRVRVPLERVGALVARSVIGPAGNGGHTHTSRLARWDQVFPVPSSVGGLEEIVAAGLRAAVVAPEDELTRWFSWRWEGAGSLPDRLLEAGAIERPAQGWVAVAA